MRNPKVARCADRLQLFGLVVVVQADAVHAPRRPAFIQCRVIQATRLVDLGLKRQALLARRVSAVLEYTPHSDALRMGSPEPLPRLHPRCPENEPPTSRTAHSNRTSVLKESFFCAPRSAHHCGSLDAFRLRPVALVNWGAQASLPPWHS